MMFIYGEIMQKIINMMQKELFLHLLFRFPYGLDWISTTVELFSVAIFPVLSIMFNFVSIYSLQNRPTLVIYI